MNLLTYNALGKGSPFKCSQTQVSYLHRTCWSRDKDVVTFQVPVNDGRSSCVQEVKAFEDLSAPRAQNFDFHHLEALQVTEGTERITCSIKDSGKRLSQFFV